MNRIISSSTKKILVTTPIFYVNGSPHIGHAFSGLLSDAYVRWQRLCGHKVIFSTGTDEHGSKVEKAAKGGDVKCYCDQISMSFRNMFQCLGTAHDIFIRTTDEKHQATVANLWRRLKNAGYIIEGSHEGWYCQSDEAFLTDQQVTEKDNRKVSIESGHPVEWISERNYLFKLSDLQPTITKWLQSNVVYPPVRENEILAFVTKTEMRDLSISRPRDRVPWAIQVPDDESQSIYVWLDALTNYLTVADVNVDPDPNHKVTWKSTGFDKVVHVVGKDILRFHTLFWPSFLIAAGIEPPDRVIVHSHWTVEKVKMSKSLGNVQCPMELVQKYELDAFRYTMLRNGGLADDADFSEDQLKARRRDELANTYGNLLSRSTAKRIMPTSSWPSVSQDVLEQNPLIRDYIRPLPQKVNGFYNDFEFSKGLEEIMQALYQANRVFTMDEPWVLAKKIKASQDGDETKQLQKQLDATMYSMLESLRVVSILLLPIIPESANKVLDAIGIDQAERNAEYLDTVPNYGNTKFPGPSSPLFPVLDES